jgi:hypothetical protein
VVHLIQGWIPHDLTHCRIFGLRDQDDFSVFFKEDAVFDLGSVSRYDPFCAMQG